MKKNHVLRGVIMVGIIYLLFAGSGTRGYAAINCYIEPWGAPPWTTPDIWVDNNGNGIQECGEPMRGQVNRLFARIHNTGTDPAANILVRFYYSPFGMGYFHEHFKQIGSAVQVNSLGGGADTFLEVSWDLTNLAENNGGLWPYPISFFDHFCVRVQIECPGDANPGNNEAQCNFTEVPCSACGFNFLIANPTDQQAYAGLVTPRLPKGWEMTIKAPGIENIQEFTLGPKEVKLARLELSHPEGQYELGRNIDVSLRLNGQIIGGITFRAVKAPVPPKKYKNSLSFHAGCAIPVGTYTDFYHHGLSLITDLDFHFGKQFSWVMLFGYNSFQSGVPLGTGTHWWNISGNLKKEFTVSPKINIYLNAGPGVYIPGNGPVKAGLNAGLGWNYALANDWRIEFGHDYHHVFGGSKVQFIVTHVGFVYTY